MTRSFPLWIVAIALPVVLQGCPSPAPQVVKPTTAPLPQPKPVVVKPVEEKPREAGETVTIGDSPAPAGESEDAKARREALEAAALREKEEAELAAKAQEEKAAEARRKEAEAKLNVLFDEAFQAVKTGREEGAVAIYEKAVADQPDSYAAYYNLGVLRERRGEREKAIEAYENALRIKGDYEPASDNLTRLYLRGDQFQLAEGLLRKRILANPRNTSFRNQLVRVMIAQGRDDQAEAEAKKVLKVDERNVDAMLNLATIWYGEKKFELARQVLDNAREIHPTNPAVWNLLAFTQLALDQKPLALDSFKKAAELREDFPEAHNNLGAMLNEVNDCDAAIRELELAVRYAPDYAQAHLNLGNAYRCGRQYPKAQLEYERALALDNRMNDPYFNLAILYLDGDIEGVEKLKRLETSLAYFDQFRNAGGKDPRYDRYLEEAKKGIEKETARLERVKENERKKKEKEIKEIEKKRAAEEKARAEAEAKRVAIDKLKVAGKADFESDRPAPTPSPAAPPTPAPAPRPKLEKVPKEDLP